MNMSIDKKQIHTCTDTHRQFDVGFLHCSDYTILYWTVYWKPKAKTRARMLNLFISILAEFWGENIILFYFSVQVFLKIS